MSDYDIEQNDFMYVKLIFKQFDVRLLSDIKFEGDFEFVDQPITYKKDILYFPLSNNDKYLGNVLNV